MSKQPIVVRSDKDIEEIGLTMRMAARRAVIVYDPKKDYSTDEAEALKRYESVAEQIWKDDTVQGLLFPRRISTLETYISIVLTVDAYEQDKRWHLSMAELVPGQKFGRPSDSFAKRISKIIIPQCTEGPTEGGIKQSRHFFQPYRPS